MCTACKHSTDRQSRDRHQDHDGGGGAGGVGVGQWRGTQAVTPAGGSSGSTRDREEGGCSTIALPGVSNPHLT